MESSNRANEKIRAQLRLHGLQLWRLAKKVGCSEATLQRWMRDPLEGEHLARVEAAVKQLIESER